VDMGEIHPAALTDGQTSLIISCRELRASRQYTAKRLSQLRSLMDRTHKGSRNWLRLKRRQLRFRAQQRRRIRDMEHKVSRAVVEYAYAAGAGTIAIGDVRNIADKGKVGKQQNQRNSLWAHGRVRGYISYKAAALGMRVVLVDEHHTTRTCPNCRQQHKPKGRLYRCTAVPLSGLRFSLPSRCSRGSEHPEPAAVRRVGPCGSVHTKVSFPAAEVGEA
jgi:putative transposase